MAEGNGGLDVTYFCDPGCPWGYAASPQIARLRYRYGEQLRFGLVLIGLWETFEDRAAIGYTAVGTAQGNRLLRRFGMPFATALKERVVGSGRACRAVVATRLLAPGRELEALRALQFAYFTTSLLPDADEGIAAALAGVDGLPVDEVLGALDGEDVTREYERDRALARTAEGSPSEFVGKAHSGDGVVRYTAPTLVFEKGDSRLEAGGFQPLDSYEVLIAHLDRSLERRWTAADPVEAIERVGYPLTTYEVAACMAQPLLDVDTDAAEDALVALQGEGRVTRTPAGPDAIWSRVRGVEPGSERAPA